MITTLNNLGEISGGLGAITSGRGGMGIDNGGTIMTLTNSGTIVGGNSGKGGSGMPGMAGGPGAPGGAGVRNEAGTTIGSLTNMAGGTISGGQGGSGVGFAGGSGGAGVFNSGTITTLTNGGTISGGQGGAGGNGGPTFAGAAGGTGGAGVFYGKNTMTQSLTNSSGGTIRGLAEQAWAVAGSSSVAGGDGRLGALPACSTMSGATIGMLSKENGGTIGGGAPVARPDRPL